MQANDEDAEGWLAELQEPASARGWLSAIEQRRIGMSDGSVRKIFTRKELT